MEEKLCKWCGKPIPRPKSGIGGFASRKYHESSCKPEARRELERRRTAKLRAKKRRLDPPEAPSLQPLKPASYQTHQQRVRELHTILSQLRSADPQSVYTHYAEARLEALS